MNKKIAWIMVIAAAIFASKAEAEEVVTWREDVSGWAIIVDRTLNDGCFAVLCFEGGTCLRIQLNVPGEQVKFFVGNDDWQSLEVGKLYDLEVRFGSRPPWTGRASVNRFSPGMPSLVMNVPFDDDRAWNFIDEFMRMTGVRISYSGNVIAHLSLSGTYAAMQEVFKCQAAMIESGQGVRSDPFAPPPRRGSDPFR